MSGRFVHQLADFIGVPAAQLRDHALLGGLMIAAASAAGVSSVGLPTTCARPAGGLAAVLLHDDCHITVHALPERELLLLDILTPRNLDGARAIDVFARRLGAREVRRDVRDRG